MTSRTRSVALLIALLLSLGGFITPRVSEAASPSVSACFKYAGTNTAYARHPLYLYRHNGIKYVSYKSGNTNDAGCGTFRNVLANSDYYFQAYFVVPDCGFAYQNCIFYGTTNALHIGTISVNFSPNSQYWDVGSYIL